ncbi:MAG TPA: phage tail sheath subtilisin-like domain-containing protein [Frankiaceae bacterium]|nr:phage tail sheath subtilisin-like domain-containing protein [Frankiaceae bacterium]
MYVEEVSSAQKVLSPAATAIAAFVGYTERAPHDDPNDPEGVAPRLVTSWSQYEQLYGGFAKGCYLPLAVYGYFQNGGALAYVCRVPNTKPAEKPATVELPAAAQALGRPLVLTSREPDADLTVVVETTEREPDAKGPAPFSITIEGGGEPVTYRDLTLDTAAAALKSDTRVAVEVKPKEGIDLSSLLDVMKPGRYPMRKADPLPVPVSASAIAGSETARRGINGLAIAEDVTMVVVPDLANAARKDDGTLDLGMWQAVQTALIAHCEQHGNRMAILDAPPDMTPQQVREWRSDQAMYASAFAALYYPWIKVDNPVAETDEDRFVPPSGHIAGLWARTDESRGVWKAPANDTIRGCLDLRRSITQNEQALLNPVGINCIRPFGTRGIRVWGARTLAADTDWQYVNVRRLFNMIETTIMQGTQFAVFEPNDPTLWQGVTRTLTGFLRGLWSAGALFGDSADQAFYVKCDAETNPPESIDQGLLVVEVGIAPVKPAEFVVFRISQKKQVAG